MPLHETRGTHRHTHLPKHIHLQQRDEGKDISRHMGWNMVKSALEDLALPNDGGKIFHGDCFFKFSRERKQIEVNISIWKRKVGKC